MREVPGACGSIDESVRGQVTIALTGPDIRPVADHLRSSYGSRLVAVFAEDRVGRRERLL